jgi:phage repressor protein C with HTH and peptisase S24 domain
MKAGVPRSNISLIELGRLANPRADVLLNLAKALNIRVEELYQAAGYIKEAKVERRMETAEEILEKLKVAQPISVPVYGEFHWGTVHDEPLEYVYRARIREAGKNLEGYVVRGDCMAPKIESGDIVIVNRDRAPEPGNIVICVTRGQIRVGRLKVIKNETWVENNKEQVKLEECQAAAVVIEVVKRLA